MNDFKPSPKTFRAWDPLTKSMSPPISLQELFQSTLVQDTESKAFSDQLVWLQCVGAKDRKNEHLFEGDILECEELKLVIKYDQQKASFVLCRTFGEMLIPIAFGILFMSSCVKIGNVYENPELLNSPKN